MRFAAGEVRPVDCLVTVVEQRGQPLLGQGLLLVPGVVVAAAVADVAVVVAAVVVAAAVVAVVVVVAVGVGQVLEFE